MWMWVYVGVVIVVVAGLCVVVVVVGGEWGVVGRRAPPLDQSRARAHTTIDPQSSHQPPPAIHRHHYHGAQGKTEKIAH
eukprot:scaffold53708_cov61-Cyclotella_meneghiniana.AAC.1